MKAFKVDQEHRADLVVYVTDNEHRAKGDANWYYVKLEHRASTRIFWVSQEHYADLKVYFSNNEHHAGWKKGHALQNRL